MSEVWEDAARELSKAGVEQARAMPRKRKRAAGDMRQAVAEVLIVWFEGFSSIHDNLRPAVATWKDYSPLEQMRALKAAEAVIGVMERGSKDV